MPEALAIARQLDLDLVEVAPGANPPVCRIMDYGKFKFDAAQRAKESRRKAVHVGIKEMKYRPKIGPGDFDTKTRQVAKFLEEGHKVKITIMFRGREVFHPELGKKILDRIAEQMDGMGKAEAVPRLDGRNMVMVLAPDKRAKQSAASKGPGHAGNGCRPGHPEYEVPHRPQRRPPASPWPQRHTPVRQWPQRRPPPPETWPQRCRRIIPRPHSRTQQRENTMPKMKTDSGARKRIKVTGTGRLRRRKAFRSHLLEGKSSVRKRRLGRETDFAPGDARQVKRMLGR